MWPTWLVLAVLVVAIVVVGARARAQLLSISGVKSDRQLLTEALSILASVNSNDSTWTTEQRAVLRSAFAELSSLRDARPSDIPPPAPKLTCAPAAQTVITSSAATFRAVGGTGAYVWRAAGGTPDSGDASTFRTSYGTVGTKVVVLSSGSQKVACQVAVNAPRR